MEKMTNYWKIAIRTTAVALISLFIIKMITPMINPTLNYDPEIFAVITVLLLLYSLTEFFVTSVPAEIHGTYRRIPVLGTTIATSLAGMIVAISLGRDFYFILAFNFVLFVASLLFITHIVVATINHKQKEINETTEAGSDKKIQPSPLSDPEEVQRLFYMSFIHALVSLALFLMLSALTF
ncbi:MAG: hypothetical protein WC467_00125 [Patescibacteria group bacterium]